VSLTKDYQVIQTLTAQRADQSFYNAILPWPIQERVMPRPSGRCNSSASVGPNPDRAHSPF
jgi:hypothetical protein